MNERRPSAVHINRRSSRKLSFQNLEQLSLNNQMQSERRLSTRVRVTRQMSLHDLDKLRTQVQSEYERRRRSSKIRLSNLPDLEGIKPVKKNEDANVACAQTASTKSSTELSDKEDDWQSKFLKAQQTNASKWSSSNEKDRRERLHKCLNGLGRVETLKQRDQKSRHSHVELGTDVTPISRLSLIHTPSSGRLSSTRLSSRTLENEEDINKRIERLLKETRGERETFRKSIVKEGDFKIDGGWIMPETEDHKPSVKNFVKRTISKKVAQKNVACDNGAFSLWPSSKGGSVTKE